MAYTGEQKREYQLRWIQARRNKAIEYLGSSCVTCGSTDSLEFDHKVRELKAANIATLLSRKWEVLKAELDKCQLLCSNCHLEKTILEQSTAEHGTHSKYCGGCRCLACKTAHNASTTAWKRKQKQMER